MGGDGLRIAASCAAMHISSGSVFTDGGHSDWRGEPGVAVDRLRKLYFDGCAPSDGEGLSRSLTAVGVPGMGGGGIALDGTGGGGMDPVTGGAPAAGELSEGVLGAGQRGGIFPMYAHRPETRYQLSMVGICCHMCTYPIETLVSACRG